MNSKLFFRDLKFFNFHEWPCMGCDFLHGPCMGSHAIAWDLSTGMLSMEAIFRRQRPSNEMSLHVWLLVLIAFFLNMPVTQLSILLAGTSLLKFTIQTVGTELINIKDSSFGQEATNRSVCAS